MANGTSTQKLIQELSKKFDEKFAKVDEEFKDLDLKFGLLRIDNKIVHSEIASLDKKEENRYNKIMNHLDGLAKGFKKIDEEQTILSAHSKIHTDKVEKLEKQVFGAIQI